MSHQRSDAGPLLGTRRKAAAPDWLRERQQAAEAQLRERGLPQRGCPDWRHSDPQVIYRTSWAPANGLAPGAAGVPLAERRLPGLNARDQVCINGLHAAELSSPQGVCITPIDQLDQPLRELLGRHLDLRYDFATLNNACLDTGYALRVPDHGALGEAIQFLSLAGNTKATPFAFHPRKLLVLGKHSTGTIIDNYLAVDDEQHYFNNTLTEIHLQEGAQLRYYHIQQESSRARHISHICVHQGRNSVLELSCVNIGGAWARTEVHAQLAEPGAELRAKGLFLGADRQHNEQRICVEHIAPHTQSDVHYRGLLDDRAQGVFAGKVLVHKGAQGIDARQMNANLLLSSQAEVDSKPELEIYANDVKCSHGATVAQLDANMLFYLQSRGMDREAARTMLCLAFAETLIGKLGLAPLEQHLGLLLRERLAAREQNRQDEAA